jgi:hypothetical protein
MQRLPFRVYADRNIAERKVRGDAKAAIVDEASRIQKITFSF